MVEPIQVHAALQPGTLPWAQRLTQTGALLKAPAASRSPTAHLFAITLPKLGRSCRCEAGENSVQLVAGSVLSPTAADTASLLLGATVCLSRRTSEKQSSNRSVSKGDAAQRGRNPPAGGGGGRSGGLEPEGNIGAGP